MRLLIQSCGAVRVPAYSDEAAFHGIFDFECTGMGSIIERRTKARTSGGGDERRRELINM